MNDNPSNKSSNSNMLSGSLKKISEVDNKEGSVGSSQRIISTNYEVPKSPRTFIKDELEEQIKDIKVQGYIKDNVWQKVNEVTDEIGDLFCIDTEAEYFDGLVDDNFLDEFDLVYNEAQKSETNVHFEIFNFEQDISNNKRNIYEMVSKLKKWKYYDTKQEEIDKLELEQMEELQSESGEENPEITKEMVARNKDIERNIRFEDARSFITKFRNDRVRRELDRIHRVEKDQEKWEIEDKIKKEKEEQEEKEKLESHKVEVKKEYETLVETNKQNQIARMEANKKLYKILQTKPLYEKLVEDYKKKNNDQYQDKLEEIKKLTKKIDYETLNLHEKKQTKKLEEREKSQKKIIKKKRDKLKKKLVPRWWFPIKQDYHDLYLKEKEEFFKDINQMRENIERKKNFAKEIREKYVPKVDDKKKEQMQALISRQYYGRRLKQEMVEKSRQNSEKVKQYFHEGIILNRPKRLVNRSMDAGVGKEDKNADDNEDDKRTALPELKQNLSISRKADGISQKYYKNRYQSEELSLKGKKDYTKNEHKSPSNFLSRIKPRNISSGNINMSKRYNIGNKSRGSQGGFDLDKKLKIGSADITEFELQQILEEAERLEKKAQHKEKLAKNLQIKRAQGSGKNSKAVISHNNAIDSNVDNLYFNSIKAKLAVLERSVELTYN